MKCRIGFAALLVLLLACGGEDPEIATITARIDGEAWQNQHENAYDDVDGYMTVIGTNGCTGLSVGFYVPATPGEHLIGADNVMRAWLLASRASWEARFDLGSGTIHITTLSANRVMGTFSFVMCRTTGVAGPEQRAISEGAFDVAYR